jgi:hypothetical protein
MLRQVIRVDKLHMCAVSAVCLCQCVSPPVLQHHDGMIEGSGTILMNGAEISSVQCHAGKSWLCCGASLDLVCRSFSVKNIIH